MVDILDGKRKKIEIPFSSVKIPSKGKIYPKDHPFHQCETVDVKEMSTPEEDILMSPVLVRKGKALDALLRSCILDKSVDPDSLLLGDKNALLLAIRISGFGASYKAHFTCESCGEKFKHSFNLSTVAMKPLTGTPIHEGENLFEFTLPRSGRKVKFCLVTDGLHQEITKAQEQRKKALKTERDFSIVERLSRLIKEIDGVSDPGGIREAVESMLAFDSRALRDHISDIEPDVLLEEEVTCEACGFCDWYDIPLGIEFFWPKRS